MLKWSRKIPAEVRKLKIRKTEPVERGCQRLSISVELICPIKDKAGDNITFQRHS